MSETPKIKFPELLQLKLPRGTNAALDELAKRQHRTKSEFARQAILHALQPLRCATASAQKSRDQFRERQLSEVK